MELIKKTRVLLLLISLFFLAFGCIKVEKKPVSNDDEIVSTPPSIDTNLDISDDKYIRVKEIAKNKDEYVFDFFSVNLSNREGEDVFSKQNLNLIKDNTIKSFKIDDDFDLGEFSLWVYKQKNQYIFLLELDDYYESIFYVYYYSKKECLTRLGDFSLSQSNVETEGLKRESFVIKKENNFFVIKTFLDEKPISRYNMVLTKDKCIPSN